MSEPDVPWDELRAGSPSALIRIRKRQPVEVLAVIATETRYDTVTLPFFDIVRDVVEKASRAVS